jgi:hypothetical protein
VPLEVLEDLLGRLVVLPERLSAPRQDSQTFLMLGWRWQMERRPIDWSAAEALAMGSLAVQGCG